MSWQQTLADAAEAWRSVHRGTEVITQHVQVEGVDVHPVVVSAPDHRPNPGNWPKIIHHDRPTRKALVIVHGLTDSPAFVEAIGLRFAIHGDGYTVLMPLLPGHGRSRPEAAMESCTYEDWRAVVDRSVEVAATFADEVSIGGFSTGGALAVDKAQRDPDRIGGKVFLFSAALDLPDPKKLFLGTHISGLIEDVLEEITGNDGLGGDSCKYSKMYWSGAHQLENLIGDIQAAARGGGKDPPFSAFTHKDRTFVAHSAADETIDIDAVMPLVDTADPGQHYLIAETLGVQHSEVVLDMDRRYEPKFRDVKPPPRANPEFVPMIERVLAYADR